MNDIKENDLRNQARIIASKTIQSDDWEKYVEGAAFKILTLEEEVKSLKMHVYFLILFVFVLPFFLSIFGLR